jgi:hypothetical protein
MAPYRPPIGPTPEATPNARARGNDTIAAVTPPKMSPRRLLKRMTFVIDMEQWLKSVTVQTLNE